MAKSIDPLAVQDLVHGLVGQSCSVIDSSFGGELVIGFGEARLADWPIRKSKKASWMLYARATPWFFYCKDGLLATEKHSLTDRALDRIGRHIVGVNLKSVQVSPESFRMDLYFTNGCEVKLIPPAPEIRRSSLRAAWELSMPDGFVLQAIYGKGFLQSSISEPWHQNDDTDALSEPMVYEAKVNTTPSVSDEVRLHRVLREVCLELGYELYEPKPGTRRGPDAIVYGPRGEVIAIELKADRRVLANRMSLMALPSGVDIRKSGSIVGEDSFGEGQVSKRALTKLLSDLVEHG